MKVKFVSLWNMSQLFID